MNQKRQRLQQFTWFMTQAISIGYAEGAELLLEDIRNAEPTPALLGHFVHATFNAPPYGVLDRLRRENHPNSAFMPKDQHTYETNQRRIVEALAHHGADMLFPNREGLIPAQRAFGEMSPQMLQRHPARFAAVKCTLEQKPDWRPDIPDIFATFDCLPEDVDAKARRTALANHIGNLGREVRSWLCCAALPGADEEKIRHAPLYGDMGPASRMFWTETSWQIDERDMPWGDAATIRATRAASAPKEQAALQAACLTDTLIRGIKGKAGPTSP